MAFLVVEKGFGEGKSEKRNQLVNVDTSISPSPHDNRDETKKAGRDLARKGKSGFGSKKSLKDQTGAVLRGRRVWSISP